jgi:hypothetical protein
VIQLLTSYQKKNIYQYQGALVIDQSVIPDTDDPWYNVFTSSMFGKQVTTGLGGGTVNERSGLSSSDAPLDRNNIDGLRIEISYRRWGVLAPVVLKIKKKNGRRLVTVKTKCSASAENEQVLVTKYGKKEYGAYHWGMIAWSKSSPSVIICSDEGEFEVDQ